MSEADQDRIGIEFISVLGLNPIEFVGVASDLGCRYIGVGLEPIVTCKGIDANWSLRKDAALRREMVASMQDHGVAISLGEGFMAVPHKDIAETAPSDLGLMAELGVRRVNMLSADPDRGRALDQCARFAELAASHGMTATLEFLPGLPIIHDLPSALAAIRHVGRPDFGLLLDTMHLFRSGASVADVAALDPKMIGYVQLCDVPRVSAYAHYADEARYDRLAPGDGELPLGEFLAALPGNPIIGLEIPMRARAEAGAGPGQRLSGAVAATRRLMAAASGCRASQVLLS